MVDAIKSEQKQSAFSVAKDYIQTPTGIQNMVIRPAVHGLRATQLALTAMASAVNGPREVLKLADHFLYWLTYPNRLRNLDRSVKKVVDSIKNGPVLKVASKISKLYISSILVIGLIADAVKNLHERSVLLLPAPALAVIAKISFLGSIAFLVLSLHQMKKQVKKMIHNEPWSAPFNLALINLVGKVFLAALAIFSIIATFYASLISPWLILGAGVGLMVCSITAHFYEKIHIPPEPKTVAL
ncbi:MAG: hypothetical protein JSS30_02085 [Verrucomicrobia bacterium]|nr:hypothetical protein [Verrucomicrobiota bacterium]